MRKAWILSLCVCALIVGATAVPRALLVADLFISLSGINCPLCDDPTVEDFVEGAPVKTLAGATWVRSDNGSPIAGGVKSGNPVRFHLETTNINASAGTTHFLFIFTTAVTGSKPGRLHVRDTSPGAKGEIKILALPPAIGDTGLLERVYRTPGADNALALDGTNSSTDPLPWDHPINNPVIDFALNASDLDPKATWGLSAVIVGIHRMPCHCEPGAPQNLANGCVPQNATDVAFSSLPPLLLPPQVYCPAASSPFSQNSCGKRQAQAWSCAEVWDTEVPRPLPFSCTVTPTADGNGLYTCTNEEVASEGIPVNSCTYTAQICQ